MQKKIDVDKSYKALNVYKSTDLPMKIFLDHYSNYHLKFINLHWHDEIELVYALSGDIKCTINNQSIQIREGNGLFINSSILHQLEAETYPHETFSISICISPYIISMPEQGIIYGKYIVPVLGNKTFTHFILKKDNDWQNDILTKILKIYELNKEAEGFYELNIKIKILEIWKFLCQYTNCLESKKFNTEKAELRSNRMNQMLNFIHESFDKNITVTDIASAANISRSECFRIFKKTLNMPPTKFLTNYRLEKAIMYMGYSDDSLTQIAYSCGFNSTSYFCSVFKKTMNTTPQKYRTFFKKTNITLPLNHDT